MRRILEDWRMRRHLLTIQHALLRPTSVAGGGFNRFAHSAGPTTVDGITRSFCFRVLDKQDHKCKF